MHSEFYNVSLDRVRYSLVWEDADTLNEALQISSSDHLLVITSAGCNVLNALLKDPASVTAVDINPVQNKLLLLKKHIILNHDHATLSGCMGFDGNKAVATSWQKIQTTLPDKMISYWTTFLQAHPEGILTSGKLETYITGFIHTLSDDTKAKLKHLLTFKSVQQQYDYFKQEIDGTSFTNNFITYFDDKNLSKGRDPRLFTYAEESGGKAFYSRLVRHLSTVLVSSNFYFRFFFFGAEDLPEALIPTCYRKENFDLLKRQLHKLTIHTTEAIDYLLSAEGSNINKASLSNIFEYVSTNEFTAVCKALYKDRPTPLRIVFWNLLHELGDKNQMPDGVKIEEAKTSAESCFYFKGVRTLETEKINSLVSIKF